MNVKKCFAIGSILCLLTVASCATTGLNYDDGITINDDINRVITESVNSIQNLGFGITDAYEDSDTMYIIEFVRSETSQYAGQYSRAQGSEIILTSRAEGIHVYLKEFQRPATERPTYRQDHKRLFYNYLRNRFGTSVVAATAPDE